MTVPEAHAWIALEDRVPGLVGWVTYQLARLEILQDSRKAA